MGVWSQIFASVAVCRHGTLALLSAKCQRGTLFTMLLSRASDERLFLAERRARRGLVQFSAYRFSICQ